MNQATRGPLENLKQNQYRKIYALSLGKLTAQYLRLERSSTILMLESSGFTMSFFCMEEGEGSAG